MIGGLAVGVCMLPENTPKSQILWLFLQINAAGVPQTEEHIAHAKALYLAAVEQEKNDAE